MKPRNIIITLIAILVVATLLFQSCKKDEEKENKSPTCEITAPNNGQEFLKGDTITISAEANDSDGNITEVRFAIDGVGKGIANINPFNYNWTTSNENIGSHIIKVSCIDNGGGRALDEITVVLYENGSSNTPPTALFTVCPCCGTTTTNFAFDASGSTDNEDSTSNLQVRWDFDGDGSWDTDWDYDKTTNHQYVSENTYQAKLEVKDTEGLTDQYTKSITVSNGGGGNTPPSALFTVSPSSGTLTTTFTFDASGSTDNEDPTSNLQVRWDFDGDGSWDTDWDYDKTTNHQYISEDTYQAKLEVKNTKGLTDQYTKSIVVSYGVETGTFTDPRDGQTYRTVKIGSQTWFAENLNYHSPNSWWYSNSSTNGGDYGRLYIYYYALGVCPNGWHLPSNEEWTILTDYLGGESVAGGKMKEVGFEHWNSPNSGATNSSGFTALPGGFRNSDGLFYDLGDGGYWWSSTEYSTWDAWFISVNSYYGQKVFWHHDWQDSGCSVRCIKD